METIRLDTFAALLKHKHELACYCPGCRRWATVNLQMLVDAGLGDRDPMNCRPKCRKCGSYGKWQLRPPVPKFKGATWMQ
jgi:hypothetical protein